MTEKVSVDIPNRFNFNHLCPHTLMTLVLGSKKKPRNVKCPVPGSPLQTSLWLNMQSSCEIVNPKGQEAIFLRLLFNDE